MWLRSTRLPVFFAWIIILSVVGFVMTHPRTLAQLSKSLRAQGAGNREVVDSCDSLDPSVKRYVDGRIEELRRSIEPEEGRT